MLQSYEVQRLRRDGPVIRWLLDSDPSIRWQVMRDLIRAPAGEVAAERARVATEGAGARLLALQGADGRWGGAAWNRGWSSSLHVLMLLRDLGLDPANRGPANERKQADRDLRQNLPMLFPSHYKFAAEDPFWSGQ